MGRLICISGAHGTGKTTSAHELASALKKKIPYEIGFIHETARECPYPVLDHTGAKPSRASQSWIFAAQAKLELEMTRKHILSVSDRSLIDCIGYTIALGYDDLASAQIEMAKLHCPGLYERVIFRPMEDNPHLKDDGFRATDAAFAKCVEKAMISIYAELNIPIINDRAIKPVISSDALWQSLVWATVK